MEHEQGRSIVVALLPLACGQRRASETRVRTDERCVTRYVIAGGDELDSWVLISTSANGDSKRNMSLDGDDVLLEFLRSVMAKGGCLVIELPASESEDPKSAVLEDCPRPQLSRTR